MDQRFNDCSLLDRRKEEWSHENIKFHTDIIFKNLEVLDGWKFIDSVWSDGLKINNKEELKRSLLRVLKVKLKNIDKDIEYNILYPELVNDQFFLMGGLYKIPIFQLFDNPILYRKTSRGNLIKLKNNLLSIGIFANKDDQMLEVFKKNIPIEKIITLLHTREEIDGFLSDKLNDNDLLNSIYEKCLEQWDINSNREESESYSELGSYFTTISNDRIRKGKIAIFSFDVAHKLDHFSRKYFKTDSIIFELLNAIHEGPRSDTSLDNKRIRLTEYLLYPLMTKVYNMLLTLYRNPRSKYQIPQNVVLDGCNKSEIVHFNFILNPIGEISNMLQCSLTGPRGFKKENVPTHLRNIDESQYGRICAADTPDREGCGVNLNMVPTVKINSDGLFEETSDESVITSYPISLSPHLQNDDQTRLQMASNQAKQTIMIKEAEYPLVKSGTEHHYLDRTSFMKRARENGEVVYLDDKYLIVKYDTDELDVLEIGYRYLYLDTVDLINPLVEEKQKFNKNDILCESRFIRNGELTLGVNVHTAIMIAEGFNYEDGIVISENLTNKMTSLHYVDLSFDVDPSSILLSLSNDTYKPLPNVGDCLKTGDVYAKLKHFDWDDGFDYINLEPKELIAPKDCKIISMEIYPNHWNKRIEDYDRFIEYNIEKQSARVDRMIDEINSVYKDSRDIKNFLFKHGLSNLQSGKFTGKYSCKGENVSGIRFKISAVYEEKIGIGDKISNRHGNKGVISRILPVEKMPKTEDGRHVDIIINPLGIISRMNVGQIFELHLGEAIVQLKNKLRKTKPPKDETFLEKFLKLVDNDKDKYFTKYTLERYKYISNIDRDMAINDLSVIMPAFRSVSYEQLQKVMKLVKAKETFKMSFGSYGDIDEEISAGYMYWNKLIHRSRDKISCRSVGPYSRKTSQPLGGKKKRGGHRLGEMEQWALASHGSKVFLKELLTTHSDSVGMKNKVLANVLQNPDLVNMSDGESVDTPQSLLLMNSYLKLLGMDMDFIEENEIIENGE